MKNKHKFIFMCVNLLTFLLCFQFGRLQYAYSKSIEEQPTEIVVKIVTTTDENLEEAEPEEEQSPLLTGKFKVTAYCPCVDCCGKTDGITSTGTKATAGRTVAVDPKVIPYGSTVVINGNEYVAEDTGGSIKGNKIDMFFNTHEEALQWGVKYCEVSVYEVLE